jgi:hypothetical protein
MKKITILSVVAALLAVAQPAAAQGSLLATLNHNDTLQTFYGDKALQVALDSAQHGDVITLSSGTFIAKDIQKAVTLRGAGMGVGTTTEPTIISGNFSINSLGGVSEKLTIEGIYTNNTITLTRNNTLKNATFIKCRLRRINTDGIYWSSYYNCYYNRSGLENASFIHCYITERIQLDNDCSANFLNCYVYDPISFDGGSSRYTFQNCVVVDVNETNVRSSTWQNCIVVNKRTDTNALESNNLVRNSVCIHDSVNVFSNIAASNAFVQSLEDVFLYYKGDYSDDITFQLTNAAKAKYLGSDGTEVGIYGGSFPFDPETSTPRITKCVVAPRSTADGKLSIDIEVSGAK